MAKKITPDLIIADVLDQWPQVIPIFIRHKMACVGCPLAAFMTLGDAINIYQLPEEDFLSELTQAISEAE